jgi:4-amino-4-deoxy-L-arabinose transferase-like glycosyltransferase
MNPLIVWLERRPASLALLLILIASLRIVSTYRVLSHTTDEPAHLAAGIEWIQNGTYTYEDQHPPLARVAGALGLHLTGSRWARGKDMYFEGFHLLGQGNRYGRALFFSRLFMLPFFWVASTVVYLWGRRLGGGGAAVLATLVFTTTPPVLAHAGLVTTDMAVTAFVGATLLASLNWVGKANWKTSAWLGFFLGIALLSKFSALAFIPAAWLLLYVTNLLLDRPGFRKAVRRIITVSPWAAFSVIVAAALVWAGYRFQVGRVDILNTTLPAPAFFTGISYVLSHNNNGHLAYLLGQKSQTGFWYYYPVVLAIKTPIATLLIVASAIWLVIRQREMSSIVQPLTFAAAVLAVGLFSRINIGVRHILPVYIGFALCCGIVLYRWYTSERRWLHWFAGLLLVWQVVSGAIAQPDYIAYTNELAGNHPEKILADSDLDWEQGMRGLALRSKELGIRKMTFKIMSSGYMIANGIPFPAYDQMPDGDKPNPGWNAVSVTAWKLSGQPKWAERAEPVERIRRSMYLYYFPFGR